MSYWDPAHHVDAVTIGENLVVVGLIIVLWRRFRGNLWAAAVFTAALANYFAVPAYFALTLGG